MYFTFQYLVFCSFVLRVITISCSLRMLTHHIHVTPCIAICLCRQVLAAWRFCYNACSSRATLRTSGHRSQQTVMADAELVGRPSGESRPMWTGRVFEMCLRDRR